MDAKKNRGIGRTDALDTHRMALAVLPLPVEKLRRPRLTESPLDRRDPSKLTPGQIEEISRWREREEELALSIARAEAVRLATCILNLGEQLKSNEQTLDELVKVSEAAPLLEEKEGKTTKEIRRCVKRYLARRVFRILTAAARTKEVQVAP